jgi:ABC-type phosphate transport system ATPase subunit
MIGMGGFLSVINEFSDAVYYKRVDKQSRGIAQFRPEDSRFFYGRASEIQQMLKHLRQRRYLYVIGPSGSGKSSAVEK